MKRIADILFYFLISLLPIGLFFRLLDWLLGGNIFITIGLLGSFIYFIVKIIKDYKKKSNSLIVIMQILIIVMSITLFAKYLNIAFLDYSGLIIIPLFVLFSIIYIIKRKQTDLKLIATSVLYLVMIIPLFGLDLINAPRQYIPKAWYNRYDVSAGLKIILPYKFEYKETEQLSKKAFILKESKKYIEAIQIYLSALKLEPKNPRLYFELADCHAKINALEKAVSLLDTAIMIDGKFAGFYNNRGLLFYKLKQNDKAILDYESAIKLDSMQGIFYSNLALVYYYQEKYDKACETIIMAKRLGLPISENKITKRIQKKYCK